MKLSLRPTFALSAICAITGLQAADQPRFEESVVKRTDQCGVAHSVDPGMITLNGFPLTVVLAEAFHVHMDQIVGPSWLEADCFAIVAKVPEGATKDQVPAMFQALLAERFKLAAHKESRPAPGYALLVDKNGPKFKESDPDSPPTVEFLQGPGASGFKGPVSMAFVARRASQSLHSPVEDLTGLKGRYDIDVSWRAMEPEHPDLADPPADIFTALRALGLRLERRKGQVEVLVIDHIERVPTEN